MTTTTLVRPWTNPHADPLCDRCRASELHAFRVQLTGGESPNWWVDVPAAIGPYDARNQARTKAEDEGGIEVQVLAVVHTRDPKADAAWQRLRDAGLTEPELRDRSGAQ